MEFIAYYIYNGVFEYEGNQLDFSDLKNVGGRAHGAQGAVNDTSNPYHSSVGKVSNVMEEVDMNREVAVNPWRTLFGRKENEEEGLNLDFVEPMEKENDIVAYCPKKV